MDVPGPEVFCLKRKPNVPNRFEERACLYERGHPGGCSWLPQPTEPLTVLAVDLRVGDVVGERQKLWAVERDARDPADARVVTAYWGGVELAWGGGVQDEVHRLTWPADASVQVLRVRL